MTESTEPTVVTPEELLAERERTIALLGFLPETKHMTIYCSRTGVAIATMELLQQAGRLPYLLHWKDSQAYHPLFSLSQQQLLTWTRKNWNQLFRSHTVDRVTDVQRQQFQIAFMAILHSLNCIDQKIPALPDFHIVITNMQRLLELAYWYNYLDSKRFKFPTYRINKLNGNSTLMEIGTYFDICDSVRHDWETSKEARFEDAKLEAARRAEKAVRGSHVRAISKKALWNWLLSSLASNNSKKYSLPEWVEWKEDAAKLWFASENAQLQYSLDDVTAIEDVFIVECTLGTTVSHAFTEELNKIRSNISNHLKVFEIDWSATRNVNAASRVDVEGNQLVEQEAPEKPGAEPSLNGFNSRTDYIRAKAKWDISCRQYAAWIEKHPPAPTDEITAYKSQGRTWDEVVRTQENEE
jgi:hypothetical protein